MIQLINYVKNGKGRGLLFILAAAVLISIAFSFVGRYYYSQTRPQLELIAEDFLPITIEKGKITSPEDTYKETVVSLGSQDKEFWVVLDTREEHLTLPTAKQGVFIMKDSIYVATQERILGAYHLVDGVWDKERLSTLIDGLVDSTLNYVVIAYAALLFVFYLLITLLICVFGSIGAKSMLKQDIYDFSVLMRFSALLVFVLEIISFCLLIFFRINISEIQICLTAVFVEWFFISREKEGEA